ncbi:MAG TPA: glycosyltransferase family 9 protein [Bacteroidales bacterium]|nr:glycosyltransferase family 9 protein [Bacteroidales bacterium]HSA43862.1 glycosyltransferase family 9 protein [Bacteroidales bacterium]
MNDQLQRFLVIQTASIGDVILITPVLEALHRQDSAAEIDVLVKKGNDALFEGHPFINKVLVWDKSKSKYGGLLRLIREIRNRKYHMVINAQRFLSGGLLTVCSGAAITAGFDKNPLSSLFTHRARHRIGAGGLHEAERNLELIPAVHPLPGKALIRLYPSESDESKVKPYLSGSYITISPASLWFTKQYPEEKWVAFLDALDQGFMVYLLGAKQDIPLNDRIMAATSHRACMNLAGQLSLLQSAALMRGARMNYANDSAPLHLCSAVGAPLAAVFCSTVTDFGFGPYDPAQHVIETAQSLACRPCGLHGRTSCPEKHFLCAHSITNEQLLSVLA